MFTVITLDIADGIARLTLNRPEARNAMTLDMGREIVAAADEIAASDARAVILTGAGEHFSVGADLKSPGAPLTETGRPDLRWVVEEVYNPIIEKLVALPQPMVSAVNGSAVGFAVGMSLTADLVVMADDAYFYPSFANIGLVPDGGAHTLVPARIGRTRAAQMLLLAEKVEAEKALDWGLVNEVVPAAELQARATELATRLADGPREALAKMKRMLGAPIGPQLTAPLAAAAVAQGEQAEGAEFLEGAMSFLQKRAPDFRSV